MATSTSSTPGGEPNKYPQHPQQPDEEYISAFFAEPESTSQKFSRKIQSNPFIPLGLFATGFCLVGGLWAFRSGRQQLSNHFQRGRVLFQGVTVAAFLGQAYLDTQEKKEAAARA